MLYYLFHYLEGCDFPGARLFGYISFRSAMAVILSLLITMIFGKRLIEYLRRRQIGESVRSLYLEGQNQKAGTPTMGGIIIIASILVPVLLLCDIFNIYVMLLIFTTIWLGVIGFADDYIKVFKKNKDGLSSRAKLLGQITLGIVIGFAIYTSDDIVIRENLRVSETSNVEQMFEEDGSTPVAQVAGVKSLKTTVPFLKNNEFDYSKIVWFLDMDKYGWVAGIIFIIIVTFIITAVSNGANITDGLDGLAAGTSAVSATTLLVFAYVSGNVVFSQYLNIMYIPGIGELVIFTSAFIGATLGFLWYNSYPAQIFMGDTGSLTIGGIIAVLAILVRKELLVPIFCGIFLMENLSVILQVWYFKRTLKKYGKGLHLFYMAPLHHHYQKKGLPEAKIVTRFLIIALILAVVSVLTLKIR
ncbi:MAG: phospho-N-acetylmuramoyl-pentapeptide-transferase [Bacteroidales bacterium]|nr:phospho-N-acetylmuramoyl-pentapeptide-transferase [Bacteroidales bacterium]MBO7568249.1 phospho-N-acetylmuramoyl-pentapeptide-transferase [Bacteroidales bacterium]MBP5683348.1 phospho-N-acetylmuramoyl-pentapeptide-transferase [Bacteroidales bacterium]